MRPLAAAALALVASTSPALAQPAAAGKDTLTLSITGPEGAQLLGWCLVRTPQGVQRLDFTGPLPVQRSWQANELRCELEARGQVTIEAVQEGGDGNSSRTHLTLSGRSTFYLNLG